MGRLSKAAVARSREWVSRECLQTGMTGYHRLVKIVNSNQADELAELSETVWLQRARLVVGYLGLFTLTVALPLLILKSQFALGVIVAAMWALLLRPLQKRISAEIASRLIAVGFVDDDHHH